MATVTLALSAVLDGQTKSILDAVANTIRAASPSTRTRAPPSTADPFGSVRIVSLLVSHLPVILATPPGLQVPASNGFAASWTSVATGLPDPTSIRTLAAGDVPIEFLATNETSYAPN